MSRSHLTTGLILVSVCLAGSVARAADKIGNTALAKNSVTQLAGAAASPIEMGDDVFANERVKTGQDSAAKFIFSDSTNLALGASSTVALDRFVYKGDTSYAKAAVTFAAGAFRFTTGGSDKGAYQLKTGTATIGVRGTQFDLSVRKGVTKLTLLEGEIVVCPRGRFDGDPRRLSKAQLKAYDCLDLTRANQTAQITSHAASIGKSPVDFAGACAGAPGLCSATAFADASPVPVPAADAPLDPSNPALCYVNQD